MDPARLFDERQKAAESRRRVLGLIQEVRNALERGVSPEELSVLEAAAQAELALYGSLRTLAHLHLSLVSALAIARAGQAKDETKK